ncbi:MAG: DUF1223 domain-containing protein [Polyangiaceae bacterium]
MSQRALPAALLALLLPACEPGRAPASGPDISAEGSPAAAAQPTDPRAPRIAAETPATARTVLAELFTSEGCSSCPPADDVLAALDRDLGPHGLITLSFHVDYWNELGWPDPYSSPLYTARQRAYATAFGERGVYTPQLVIAGREGFVGSNAAQARDSIRALLAAPSPAPSIHLEAERESPTTLRVRWSTTLPPGSRLYLAAVEPSTTTRVPRGENAGRTLHHVHIVRALDSAPEREGNRLLTVSTPTALQAVAWIQSPDLTIPAATKATPLN